MTQMLIIITGLSGGVGKDTIVKHLLSRGFQQVVTFNTRSIRPGEIEGVDYHFVDKKTFRRFIKEKKLLEYVKIAGEYHGTPKNGVDLLLSRGVNVVLRLDYCGAGIIKKLYPQAVVIFITVAAFETLRSRMKKRGDTPKKIKQRMALIAQENRHAQEADYVIFNEDGQLKETFRQVDAIIDSASWQINK